METVYRADPSLPAKLRRRLVRLAHRKPVLRAPERPMITFSFDDAPATATAAGAAVLEERGVRGVYYVCAGLAGEVGHMGRFAGREDMMRVAQAGHEIGCHTFSHLDCGQAAGAAAAADIELNASALSDWDVAKELQTFAYPYGDVGFAAKREVAARFAMARALHPGLIHEGVDLNQAPSVGIEGEGGEANARAWLEKAAISSSWLILYTHGVEDAPTEFGCSRDALARLADAALERGFQVVTAREGAQRLGAAQ
jgi:peptidoglycan/xylan/chitin deacetylase (PgdA/CDA1 family)